MGLQMQLPGAQVQEEPLAPLAGRVAAVVYPIGFDIDGLFGQLVMQLRRQGLQLGGLIQHNEPVEGQACANMVIEDIVSGQRILISQDRGRLARGCRLDATGLAEASPLLAAITDIPLDLVVVSKFGKQEACGGGLRAEITGVILAGHRVMVAVSETLTGEWDGFLGEAGDRLTPDLANLLEWGSRPV